MDESTVHQILDELISSLEPLEAQNSALLQFLKEKGLTNDKELAPYLEQAGNASNVRWRAFRLRVAALIASAMTLPSKEQKVEPGGAEKHRGGANAESGEQAKETKQPGKGKEAGGQPKEAAGRAEEARGPAKEAAGQEKEAEGQQKESTEQPNEKAREPKKESNTQGQKDAA